MDIRFGTNDLELSNFAFRTFRFRGVLCKSMEGLLQSIKWDCPETQKEVCLLVGIKAKRKGFGYILMENCPLCSRPMPDGSYNSHHLIPKTFKGKDVIDLHFICHSKLHHTFSERDMANYYHTIDRIMENKDIQKFVKWVSKKDPMFYDGNKDTKQRKRKRR